MRGIKFAITIWPISVCVLVMASMAAYASWLHNPAFVGSLNKVEAPTAPAYSTNTVTYSNRNAWGSAVNIPFANVPGTWVGMEFIMNGFSSSNPSAIETSGTTGALSWLFPFATGMGGGDAVSGITITLSSFSAWTGSFTNNGVYALPAGMWCEEEGCFKFTYPNANTTFFTALTAGTFTTTSWTLNLIYTP